MTRIVPFFRVAIESDVPVEVGATAYALAFAVEALTDASAHDEVDRMRLADAEIGKAQQRMRERGYELGGPRRRDCALEWYVTRYRPDVHG